MRIHQTVANLPTILEPNSMYFVRTGSGFDLYATTNLTPPTVFKINSDGTAVEEFKPETAVYQINSLAIFRAWERTDATGYKAISYNLNTGLNIGENSGPLPIPEDLTILTYT